MQNLMQSIQGKPPQDISEILELPCQRALIDFDMFSVKKQIIGADPIDLSDIVLFQCKRLSQSPQC